MSEQFNTIDKYINVKTAFGYQKKPNPNYIATNGEIPTVQRTIAQVDADRMNQDSINVQNTTEAKGFGVLGGYLKKSKKDILSFAFFAFPDIEDSSAATSTSQP